MNESEKVGVQIPSNIPDKYHKKYADIAEMILLFCDECLDSEYLDICIQASRKH